MKHIACLIFALLAASAFATSPETKAIPMDQIGAEAGKQYKGDGLSVTATEGGALVRCLFQRLEGKITETGLTLYSTIDDASTAGFQV